MRPWPTVPPPVARPSRLRVRAASRGTPAHRRGLFDREPIGNGKTSYRVFYRLKAEHVVMSQLFGWEGALALSEKKYAGKLMSPQFPTFLCETAKLDRGFLGWLMRRPSFWEDPGSRASGLGDRRRPLNPDALFECEIPLPPLSEQRRVVARIEELAAQIHAAHTLRHQAAEETKALPLSKLGAVLGHEAKQRGTSRLEDWLVEAGYGSSEKCETERVEGAMPVLRIPNVASERISLTDMKYARLNQRDSERLLLSEGDVLVVRTNGSVERVGRSAVVPRLDEPFAFASYMILLRFPALLDRAFKGEW